jgi:hypothetical protein
MLGLIIKLKEGIVSIVVLIFILSVFYLSYSYGYEYIYKSKIRWFSFSSFIPNLEDFQIEYCETIAKSLVLANFAKTDKQYLLHYSDDISTNILKEPLEYANIDKKLDRIYNILGYESGYRMYGEKTQKTHDEIKEENLEMFTMIALSDPGFSEEGKIDQVKQIEEFFENNIDIKNLDENDSIERVTKLLNYRWLWDRTGDVRCGKCVNDEMFAILDLFGNDANIDQYSRFHDGKFDNNEKLPVYSSLMNYIDSDNMSLENFHKNTTINTYHMFMKESIKDIFIEIEKKDNVRDNKPNYDSLHTLSNIINNTKQKPILEQKCGCPNSEELKLYSINYGEKNIDPFKYCKEICIDMTEYIKNGLLSVEKKKQFEEYARNKKKNCNTSNVIITELDEDTFNEIDDIQNSTIQLINDLESCTNNAYNQLYKSNYIKLENFLLNKKEYNNILKTYIPSFDEYIKNYVLSRYQTILDTMRFVHHHKEITLAIKFTIYYIIDDDKGKDQKFDNISQLYTSIFDTLHIVKQRKRLDEYHKSRKPDIQSLKKLYNTQLKQLDNLFIQKLIKDQWYAFGKQRRPPKYKFLFDWIRDIMDYKKMYKLVFDDDFDDRVDSIDKGAKKAVKDTEKGIIKVGDDIESGVNKSVDKTGKNFNKFGTDVKKGYNKEIADPLNKIDIKKGYRDKIGDPVKGNSDIMRKDLSRGYRDKIGDPVKGNSDIMRKDLSRGYRDTISDPIKGNSDIMRKDLSRGYRDTISDPIKGNSDIMRKDLSRGYRDTISDPIKGNDDIIRKDLSRGYRDTISDPIKGNDDIIRKDLSRGYRDTISDPIKGNDDIMRRGYRDTISDPIKGNDDIMRRGYDDKIGDIMRRGYDDKIGDPVKGNDDLIKQNIRRGYDDKIGDPVKGNDDLIKQNIRRGYDDKIGDPVKGNDDLIKQNIRRGYDDKIGDPVKGNDDLIKKGYDDKIGDPVKGNDDLIKKGYDDKIGDPVKGNDDLIKKAFTVNEDRKIIQPTPTEKKELADKLAEEYKTSTGDDIDTEDLSKQLLKILTNNPNIKSEDDMYDLIMTELDTRAQFRSLSEEQKKQFCDTTIIYIVDNRKYYLQEEKKKLDEEARLASTYYEPPRCKPCESNKSKLKESSSKENILKESESDQQPIIEEFVEKKEDIIEGFGIPGVKIPSPVDIFKSILKVVIDPIIKGVMFVLGDFIQIMKSLFMFITNPAKLIEFFVRLMIFFILIIVVILYAIKISKDITLGECIIYLGFLILVTILLLSVYCILYVFVWIIMKLDTSWPINGKLYPFFYRFFGANENLPGSWYKYGGFHDGNKNERLAFFSYSKCSEQYKPNDRFGRYICTRKSDYEPRFCPEANIYRLYKSNNESNLKIFKPFLPVPFSPDMDFVNSGKPTRRKKINTYIEERTKYLESCNSSMQPYHSIAKNICRSMNSLDIQSSKNKDLNNICYEYFCKNGSREPFCFKFNSINTQNSIQKPKTLPQRLAFALVFVMILIVVTSGVLSSVVNQGDS